MSLAWRVCVTWMTLTRPLRHALIAERVMVMALNFLARPLQYLRRLRRFHLAVHINYWLAEPAFSRCAQTEVITGWFQGFCYHTTSLRIDIPSSRRDKSHCENAFTKPPALYSIREGGSPQILLSFCGCDTPTSLKADTKGLDVSGAKCFGESEAAFSRHAAVRICKARS